MPGAIPHRVLSLGLYSTAAFRTADDAAKVRGVVAAMRAKGIPPVLETLKERWFTPEFAARHREVIERRMQQVIDTDPEVFLSVFDIYAETEMAPWIGEIRHPSLVLTGENDGGCNPRLNAQIAAVDAERRTRDPSGATPRDPARGAAGRGAPRCSTFCAARRNLAEAARCSAAS